MLTPLVLFAGSRTDCVSVISGGINESTSFINPTYSDAGITGDGVAQGTLVDPGSAPLMEPFTVQGGHSFYFHGQFGYTDGYGGGSMMLALVDAAGAQWVQLLANGQLQYNAGTAEAVNWQNIGLSYGTPGGYDGPSAIDIKLDIDAEGNHTILLSYGGMAVVGPIGFSQPLLTGIRAFQITNQTFRTASTWSQLLCTQDLSTIGAVVQTVRATGAGSHSDWSGAYTDVNEVITDDTTYNQALAASEEQSYPMGNIAVPAGFTVGGVFHWFRIKSAGTPPENVQSLIRTAAGVDHLSGNLTEPLVTFEGRGAVYPVNPDTGVAWTQADWNNPVQLGFVSET